MRVRVSAGSAAEPDVRGPARQATRLWRTPAARSLEYPRTPAVYPVRMRQIRQRQPRPGVFQFIPAAAIRRLLVLRLM